MSRQDKLQIGELEAKLTPRGAFEAIFFGVETAEGRRFIETYGKIRELSGDKVKWNRDGTLNIK